MKKFTFWILVVLLCVCTVLPASAASAHVVDGAQLLSVNERADLENKLSSLSKELEADIVVVTVDSLDGAYIRDYADDYYDYNGYGEDGVLLLIAMDDREYWVSTAGRCIDDIDVDDLEDAFLSDLSDGDYYEAFCGFADACRDELEGLPLVAELLICLGIGAVVGLITVLVMKGKLKTVRSQSGADSYMRHDMVNITHQSDMFLYQTVTRHAKPQSNGGGSHRGSSGRSHGGGGGRF